MKKTAAQPSAPDLTLTDQTVARSNGTSIVVKGRTVTVTVPDQEICTPRASLSVNLPPGAKCDELKAGETKQLEGGVTLQFDGARLTYTLESKRWLVKGDSVTLTVPLGATITIPANAGYTMTTDESR